MFHSACRRTALFLFLVLLAALAQPAGAQSNLTILIHDAWVEIIEGSSAYDVTLTFSLLDSNGNPIKDAGADDFSLEEDNQVVEIVSVEPVEDEPISIAVLLDTSGSMIGEKMSAARDAAASFIGDMRSGDEVAVLTFDLTTVHRIDFTTDLSSARQQVELIGATPDAGTCMYDAAYETVQMTAAGTDGRRAVVLLTDGVDEAGGKPCSLYTMDELIAYAADVRVPIYTIGLGKSVDRAVLDRIARATGGRSQYAEQSTQLNAIFGLLTNELRSQYILHYTSIASAGEHTLTLGADIRGVQNEAVIEVEMPALPYRLTFTAPAEGSTVSGVTTLSVSISGQGGPIQQVLFLANDTPINSDNSLPYEITWDPGEMETGAVFLQAVAQDAAGTELVRGGVSVTYQPEGNGSSGTDGDGFALSTTTIILAAVGGVLLMGGLLVFLLIAGKKRRKRKDSDREWAEKVQGRGGTEVTAAIPVEHTLDSFTPGENSLGVLTILQSDDPMMEGKRIEIAKPVTTLGRLAQNDIIFTKDSPVSRRHAVIEEHGGRLFVSEVASPDDSGAVKRPPYGTFINDVKIGEPAALHDGDVIRLGKRVRIRFNTFANESGNSDNTLDGFSSLGDDTLDQDKDSR